MTMPLVWFFYTAIAYSWISFAYYNFGESGMILILLMNIVAMHMFVDRDCLKASAFAALIVTVVTTILVT